MSYEKEFKKLGQRYKELRCRLGMVQEDVLEHDFSVRHYQQLEAGRPHSLRTFVRIACMFSIKPEVLIKGIFDSRNGFHKNKK